MRSLGLSWTCKVGERKEVRLTPRFLVWINWKARGWRSLVLSYVQFEMLQRECLRWQLKMFTSLLIIPILKISQALFLRFSTYKGNYLLISELRIFMFPLIDFLGSSDGKESTCNLEEPDSIPGSGRSPGGGPGNPLQYSCMENPMDRGAWWPTVHRVTQSRTGLNRLSSMNTYFSVNGETITSLGGLYSV